MAVCEDRRVERVVHAVVRDLTKRQTLADAAAIAGLEVAYFSKLFRRITYETYGAWHARIRVEEAKKQLVILDLSITAIAASVGYADVTTFERVFRKLAHASPRQYRANQTAANEREDKERRFHDKKRRIPDEKRRDRNRRGRYGQSASE